MAELILQGGVQLKIDSVPFEEAIQRFTNLIVQGLKDTGAEANPLRKQFEQWAILYRTQALKSFDNAASNGWKRLSPVTLELKKAQKNRLGGLSSKAPITDALRATDIVRNVLEPKFRGQPGAVEIQRVNGVELGWGGNAIHPTIKKKDIKAVQKALDRASKTTKPKRANVANLLNPPLVTSTKSKNKSNKKKRARAKKPITVAEVARIHNEGDGVARRSIDDRVFLEATIQVASEMGELTLAAVTELAKRAGFGTKEVFEFDTGTLPGSESPFAS